MSQRLNLIERHLQDRGEWSYDDSLNQYRQRGLQFNQMLLRTELYSQAPDLYEQIISTIEESPSFDLQQEIEIPRSQLQGLVMRQIMVAYGKHQLNLEDDLQYPYKKIMFMRALQTYSLQAFVRFNPNFVLFSDSLIFLGTEKHRQIVEDCYAMKLIGAFAMTELGHGSNAQRLETTAEYDQSSRSFIFNSPTQTSAKAWSGGLAQTANWAIVYARLIVKAKDQGVVPFVVQIRNKQTHQPFEGITIGDIGPKLGYEGVDNGFMVFNNFRAPYDSLLDRYVQVDQEGNYQSTIDNPSKRFGINFACMMRGRVIVFWAAFASMAKSLLISIRYAAARKQFSLNMGQENPILDFPLHRYRLMPHLAKTFAVGFICRKLEQMGLVAFSQLQTTPFNKEGVEFHNIGSMLKLAITQYSFDATNECRAACGGLGYSEYNLLDRIRSETDMNLTWEGDNDVLFQQGAGYLLKQYERVQNGQQVESQLCSCIQSTLDYSPFGFKVIEELTDAKLLSILALKLNIALQRSQEKLQAYSANDSMVFYLKDAALAFCEVTIANEMFVQVQKLQDPSTQQILKELFRLYSLNCFEKSFGMFSDRLNVAQQRLIRTDILRLCNVIGENSVKLVECFGIIDKAVGAPIGQSNGQIYRNFLERIQNAPNAFTVPEWFAKFKEFRDRN